MVSLASSRYLYNLESLVNVLNFQQIIDRLRIQIMEGAIEPTLTKFSYKEKYWLTIVCIFKTAAERPAEKENVVYFYLFAKKRSFKEQRKIFNVFLLRENVWKYYISISMREKRGVFSRLLKFNSTESELNTVFLIKMTGAQFH